MIELEKTSPEGTKSEKTASDTDKTETGSEYSYTKLSLDEQNRFLEDRIKTTEYEIASIIAEIDDLAKGYNDANSKEFKEKKTKELELFLNQLYDELASTKNEKKQLYKSVQFQPLANTNDILVDDNYDLGTFNNIAGNNVKSMTPSIYKFISETRYLSVLNTSAQITSGLHAIPVLNLFASALILAANFYLLSDARNDLFILMNDAYRVCKNYIKILYFINGVYDKLRVLQIANFSQDDKDKINDIIQNLLDILIDGQLMKRVVYILKYLYAFSPHTKSLKNTGTNIFSRAFHRVSKRIGFWEGFSRMAAFFNSPIYFRKLGSGLIGLNGDMLVTITKFNLLIQKLQIIENVEIKQLIDTIFSDKLFKYLFLNELMETIKSHGISDGSREIKEMILFENKEEVMRDYIEMINTIRKENKAIGEDITIEDLDERVINSFTENIVNAEAYQEASDLIKEETVDEVKHAGGGSTKKIRRNKKKTYKKNRKTKQYRKTKRY